MRNFIKNTVFILMFFAVAASLASCDKNADVDDDTVKNKTLSGIVTQYVNATVIPTYTNLADASIELYDALETLKSSRTDANIKKVAEKWVAARDYWELSEAFLFGAVADFGIDPHIDTWPLDETAFNATITNSSYIDAMADEDGDIWVAEHLGAALLGFHGIEYIIYSESKVKSAASITEAEVIFATAVAGDLRNQCLRLEAAWKGEDNVSAAKKEIITEKELQCIPTDRELYYGENMLKAGDVGSTYRSMVSATNAILDGCATISEEVGDIKIGNAYRGDDVNYLESPYSYNSLVDFANNIISIQNAYMGGADASNRGKSVSEYIKSVDAQLDTNLKNAITNTISKIRAINYPFEKNYSSPEAGAAIEACAELTDLLIQAKDALQK